MALELHIMASELPVPTLQPFIGHSITTAGLKTRCRPHARHLLRPSAAATSSPRIPSRAAIGFHFHIGVLAFLPAHLPLGYFAHSRTSRYLAFSRFLYVARKMMGQARQFPTLFEMVAAASILICVYRARKARRIFSRRGR